MILAELIVIACRGSEVPTVHLVVRALEDTSVRKHGLRKRVRIVRIGVEERIAVPDGRCAHLPVSQSLVGIVKHIMLTSCLRIFHGGQGTEFHLLDRSELQLGLIPEIEHVQIKIVVVQLVHNVERSVVPCVEHIRIKSPGSVECVGVRVDVEISLNLAGHGVDRRTQGSRSPLLSVGSVADEIKGQVVEDLVGQVHIRCVTLNLTLVRPTRIVHYTH